MDLNIKWKDYVISSLHFRSLNETTKTINKK